MPEATKSRWRSGARFCASCTGTLCLWTLWLALVVLLACQAYVASVNELQVPPFMLRAIEAHLAESGVSVKFGAAIFDPTGRVLLRNASFRLDSFAEPAVTADAIYLRLDPVGLLERRFEAREIRATGANLYIPAMLSASGRAETVVKDLDAAFSIASRGDEFTVDYLSCRVGGMSISAHGQVNAGVAARVETRVRNVPLTQFLSRNYTALAREFSKAEEQLAGLDGATLRAVLTPSDTRGAIVSADLFARSLRLSAPVAVDAEGLRLHVRVPLLGGAPIMTSLSAWADRVAVRGRFSGEGVHARVRGILKVDTLAFSPRRLDVTAAAIRLPWGRVEAPIVGLSLRPDRTVSAQVRGLVLGLPVAAQGRADLAARTADIDFDGLLSPDAVGEASRRTGRDLARFADLRQPVSASGRLTLGPGWAFQSVRGHVDTRDLTAYRVRIDEARGDVSYSRGRLLVENATVVSGGNLAEGSYEQDFRTRGFRYLLGGRLRPMDISPWIPGAWWPVLWAPFGFEAAPPDASVDIRGRYTHHRHFSVFGYVEARNPVIKGVPFDTARTLLYVDQDAVYGYEASGTKGGGGAAGSFRMLTAPATGAWTSLDFDATANLDPTPLGSMLPGPAKAALAAFAFDKAPQLAVEGHFERQEEKGPVAHRVHARLRSAGGMRAHGVAFDRAAFTLDVDGDNISVADVDAGLAGGSLTGSGSVTGSEPDRRLRFKAALDGASLGLAAGAAAGYVKGSAQPSPALATFARDKSGVRLDLNASGEGRLGDIASIVGEGSVQIQGSKLGELSLLGGLSRVLKFAELRFTQAQASFKIQDGALDFGDVKVIGANSAIRAKGTYSIGQHALDFSATIYPFMESHSLLQVINPLSAPFSAIFRVRLTGSVEKPVWRLAYSPLNLLRPDLGRGQAAEKAPAPAPAANPPP
ncbi:MAG TPA: AsmA-like C-terminal region-containing protein [Opitutaceae bacterium]|jgi:hypothetical protein